MYTMGKCSEIEIKVKFEFRKSCFLLSYYDITLSKQIDIMYKYIIKIILLENNYCKNMIDL